MEIHGKVSSHQNIGGQVNTPPDVKDEIHGKVKTSQGIGGGVNTTSAVNGDLDRNVKYRSFSDTTFLYGTTKYWNAQPRLISQSKTIYVYTDHDQDGEGNDIPGFKLGDGMAYLIDMPFVTQNMEDHIKDTVRHITQDERNFWNDKVRCYISADNENNLVFTTD